MENSKTQSEKQYWCFICNLQVTVKEKGNEVVCEKCDSEFIEEITNENDLEEQKKFKPVIRSDHPQSNSNNLGGASTSNFSSSGQNQFNNNININPHPSQNRIFSQPGISVQIIASSNGNIQTHTTNNFQTGSFPLITNIMGHMNSFLPIGNLNNQNFAFPDHFNRQNDQHFQNILDMLMRNDPNRWGNPPASVKLVNSLPRIKICDENIKEFSHNDCLVCMDGFKISETLVKLKCGHPFHELCIGDWLKVNNTCPVCRFEMETDDPGYERTRKSRDNNNSHNPSV